jgi:hypothetical protein
MKMKKQLTVYSYCEGSNTIRTMPQNYIIAKNESGRWVCDPDCAVPVKMAVHAMSVLHSYEAKYCDGFELLAMLTPKKFYK